jgi:hypothetical protein
VGSVGTFIRKPGNQRLLSWLGGGGAVAAAGIWAVVTYLWPAHETPKAVCAQQGGIAAGRDASGNTLNYHGSAPAGGGAAACADAAKK